VVEALLAVEALLVVVDYTVMEELLVVAAPLLIRQGLPEEIALMVLEEEQLEWLEAPAVVVVRLPYLVLVELVETVVVAVEVMHLERVVLAVLWEAAVAVALLLEAKEDLLVVVVVVWVMLEVKEALLAAAALERPAEMVVSVEVMERQVH